MILIKDAVSIFSEVETRKILEIARHTLEELDRAEQDISIVFNNNAYIQEFNSQYLGKNNPTDVLSFSANEPDPDSGRLYLGDILISAEKAKSQAKEHNTSFFEEISLLIVHGIMHLSGYDHDDKKTEIEMFGLQAKILESMSKVPNE